jgi:16S rRNA U516 pseudouridylate synthase RsuA-like enzyme
VPCVPGHVSLNRALSKLGMASRSDPTRLVTEGRVVGRSERRVILLHKPGGVVTTRRDPMGRRALFELTAAFPGFAPTGAPERTKPVRGASR